MPPPPPPYTAFDGQAVTLGGANVMEQDTNLTEGIKKPIADESQPHGNLRIQFHNGTKEMLKVNHSMKYELILDYIAMYVYL